MPSRASMRSMLRASITKVELSYPENGVPQLKIKGEDKSIEMGLVEKKKNWTSTTVNAIVKKIAQPYHFADVVANLEPRPACDAREPGRQDRPRLPAGPGAGSTTRSASSSSTRSSEEVLYFIPERRILHLKRADKLVLRYRQGVGSNLMTFCPTFDASYIDRVKEVHDLDQGGQQVNTPPPPPVDVFIWKLAPDLSSRASRADLDRVDGAVPGRGAGQGEAPAAAGQAQAEDRCSRGHPAAARRQGRSAGVRRLGMSATGTTVGSIWLRAKCNVSITGVHERFAGDWYINSVTHTIDASGYKSDFKAVR